MSSLNKQKKAVTKQKKTTKTKDEKKDKKDKKADKKKIDKKVEFQYKDDRIDQEQAIIEFKLDGTIIAANENFLKIFGYKREEIRGKPHNIFVEESYKNSMEYKEFWERLYDGKVNIGEYKRVGKNDKQIWLQAFYTPIVNSSGKMDKIVMYATDISAQKFKNDNAHRRLFERSAEGIRIVDPNFNVIEANKEFIKLSGLKRNEVIGSKCYESFAGSKCHTEECPLKTVQKQDKRIELIVEKEHSDGNTLPCMMVATSIRGEKGEFQGIAESFRNISDLTEVKKESETKMQELSELQQLFEGSSDGIRVIDKDFNVIKVNEPFLKMCGKKREEVIGSKCYESFFGKFCHTENCPLLTIEKRDKRVEVEVKKKRADGNETNCLLVARSFKDENKNFMGIVESFRDVSDLTKAKKDVNTKLQELFELQQLFEGSSDGIRVIDKDFNVIKVNEPFLKMCGKNREEIIGRKCYDHFSGKFCHAAACPLNVIKKQDKRIEVEVEKERANGEKTTCLLVAKSFKDANNELLGVVESFRDIDELSKEREKNEKENWLKTGQNGLIEITRGDQSLAILAKNIITYLAKYIEAQVGAFYFAEDGGDLKLLSGYAYVNRKSLSNKFKIGEGLVGQVALEKETIMISDIPEDYVRINSGLGDASPKNIVAVPIYFEGVLYGVIEFGSFNVFTDRQIEFLNSLIENIGIVISTAISRDKLKELLEETRSQEEELRANNEEMQTQQEKLQDSNRELEVRANELKESQDSIEKQNNALEDQKTQLVKQRDAIEVKNVEVEKARTDIEEKAKELEVASKYKSEFLANMSHELRTPLNSLLLLANSLAENEERNLTEEQVESAQIIHSGGKDLLNLINDILDLSKVEAGKLEVIIEDINVEEVADNLKRQFTPVAKHKNLDFIIDNQYGKGFLVRTDSNRLEQILKNFLSNAFKFTEKGSVTIQIHQPTANMHFKQKHLSPKNCLAFKIIDTGTGIPKDKQAAIFEAFQQADGTTSRQHGGTGLGLSISRELAKLLDCEIQLESEEGKGSAFSLYLPFQARENRSICEQKEEKPTIQTTVNTTIVNSDKPKTSLPPITSFITQEEETERTSKQIVGEKTLLIIEDDEDFQNVLQKLAEERGYKTVLAKTGHAGITLARRILPTAISLDICLPDMDGERVLDALKYDATTRQIPIHVISIAEDLLHLRQKGAISISKKPLNPKELAMLFDKFDAIAANKTRNVLVVEDDIGNQKAIAKTINLQSVKITEVTSGKDAIKSLKDSNASFEVMILDLGLPDMDGLKLLKKVRDLSDVKTPPVIVYTGKDMDKKEYQELNEFTTSFVLKGADSNERLLDELTLFLHTKREENPKKPTKPITVKEFDKDVLKDKQILLVDDDLRNTFALSGILRKHGLKVIMADNGKTALEKLENDKNVQLVIMDIMMPIMDGYEAMTRIRQQEHFAELPIIALTAKVLPEDRRKSLECGANDFLTKPVDIQTLLNITSKWLA